MASLYEMIGRIGKNSTPALLIAVSVFVPCLAEAAYTRATSGPVSVTEIYTNEYGSPFVWFNAVVNSACAGGGEALYLYDMTQSTPNPQYQNNKMAILLSAEAQGKQVILDYFYDPTITNSWSSCFVEGIYLVN